MWLSVLGATTDALLHDHGVEPLTADVDDVRFDGHALTAETVCDCLIHISPPYLFLVRMIGAMTVLPSSLSIRKNAWRGVSGLALIDRAKAL